MAKSEGSINFLEQPIDGGLRDRMDILLQRFDELESLIGNPEVQNDRARFQDLLKEHGAATPQVANYREYVKCEQSIAESKELIEGDDEEMRELAEMELEEQEAQIPVLARKIREHILDQQVEGDSPVIFEIRAGTGGDEAALFVGDVFKMYSLYAEKMRWKVEIIEASQTDLGGYKYVIFSVKGKNAWGRLRFESGGHRVQRVPDTETQGRVHTSAITVAVMQEVEEEEFDINDKDLRIDTFCASGPGGQKVNKTASAVRITHIPTGTVVSIQDEKSQHKNKSKAMRVLRSRIKEKQDNDRREAEDEIRRGLIGTGDRSDRVRTYNFPQNRFTDHRINVTLYSLDRIIGGDLEEMLDRLVSYDREQRVQSLGE